MKNNTQKSRIEILNDRIEKASKIAELAQYDLSYHRRDWIIQRMLAVLHGWSSRDLHGFLRKIEWEPAREPRACQVLGQEIGRYIKENYLKPTVQTKCYGAKLRSLKTVKRLGIKKKRDLGILEFNGHSFIPEERTKKAAKKRDRRIAKASALQHLEEKIS